MKNTKRKEKFIFRRENDKLLPEHAKDASYPEDWWLDEADSADGLPVFAMDEAEDFVKDRQRLKGVPMVTGYEALERHRGIRRPRRKLSRREQRAWEKAQKYEAKLHKAHEKEERKLELLDNLLFGEKMIARGEVTREELQSQFDEIEKELNRLKK